MKTRISWPGLRACAAILAGLARFFDIVNGFLIDAVAHGIGLPPVMDGGRHYALLQMCNLAEIIVRT
jgi:hypothetical protein